MLSMDDLWFFVDEKESLATVREWSGCLNKKLIKACIIILLLGKKRRKKGFKQIWAN